MSMWSNEQPHRFRFAGVEIELIFPQPLEFVPSRNLEPFQVEEVKDPRRFLVEMADELPAPAGKPLVQLPELVLYHTENGFARYGGMLDGKWENARFLTEQIGNEYRVRLPARCYSHGVGCKSVINALGVEHLVVEAGGVVVHASCVNRNGKAILFTAPSGTGKSTQAALWKTYRNAETINGDRAVIRMRDGAAEVCGLPFAGSSGICRNQTLPLEAIVYLAKAPQNILRQLQGFEAFRRVWEGCSVNTWDNADVSRASETVQNVLRTVPVYYFACTPDEAAVNVLAAKLTEQE